MNNTVLIEADNVLKSYAQGNGVLAVLKGVNVTIKTGETVAIVGPSGAGKSTLMHILRGLDKPTGGIVRFEGQDVYALNDARRAQMRCAHFGFVFQSYHLLPELSALENVILPRMVKNNSRKTSAIEAEGLKLLERVGLASRVSHRSNQLSGGEQQRVAIARSLMNAPKILLCDEPTGNLDSLSGQAVIDALLGINQNSGQTVVIVTHDDKIAKRMSRIIAMRDGMIE